jgi:hypothetical protein
MVVEDTEVGVPMIRVDGDYKDDNATMSVYK